MRKLTIIWLICMVALIVATVALFYIIAEQTGFITGDWPTIAILVEVILGILVYCWFVSKLKEAIDEEKKRAIWIRSIVGMVTAGLLILLLIDEIDVGQLIEILVLLGLVLITAEYVIHTRIMANETRYQRYDTLRPVIDIEGVRPGPITTHVNKQQTTDEEKISLNFFECVLCNYGAGAAIDVYSPQQHSNVKPDSQRIGNIQAKEYKEMVANAKGPAFIIARKIGNQWFLVAYYRDVYGRCFESKRSVNLEDTIFKIGSLKHRKLDKQKDSELINEIWPPSDAGGNTND